MIFSDVLQDIKKLVDLPLSSIRPGASVCIKKIDESKGNLILIDSRGRYKTRPISELEQIWKSLMALPAIRVDEVLHGSGSSRNQPETIIANLPYVEHVKIKNKKHIVFVKKSTHPFGSLKELEPSEKAALINTIASYGIEKKSETVIVTAHLSASIKQLKSVLSYRERVVEEGVYELISDENIFTIVSSSYTSLPIGVYPTIKGIRTIQAESVTIGNKSYYLLKTMNGTMLLKV